MHKTTSLLTSKEKKATQLSTGYNLERLPHLAARSSDKNISKQSISKMIKMYELYGASGIKIEDAKDTIARTWLYI